MKKRGTTDYGLQRLKETLGKVHFEFENNVYFSISNVDLYLKLTPKLYRNKKNAQ